MSEMRLETIIMNEGKTVKKLKEEEDYYFNKDGLLVLTREFLLKRGFCCHNNCTNCPYKTACFQRREKPDRL